MVMTRTDIDRMCGRKVAHCPPVTTYNGLIYGSSMPWYLATLFPSLTLGWKLCSIWSGKAFKLVFVIFQRRWTLLPRVKLILNTLLNVSSCSAYQQIKNDINAIMASRFLLKIWPVHIHAVFWLKWTDQSSEEVTKQSSNTINTASSYYYRKSMLNKNCITYQMW